VPCTVERIFSNWSGEVVNQNIAVGSSASSIVQGGLVHFLRTFMHESAKRFDFLVHSRVNFETIFADLNVDALPFYS
jgi:hypothetical protein